MKKILILSVLLLLFPFANKTNLFAQNFDQNTYYRLTTKWLGEDKSMDVINDGENDMLQLAATGKYLGQYWKITPLENGYYRLTTKWKGEDMSLDVINDGINNKLRLFGTAKFTGQYWKITPLEDGYYRLTTLWQGDDNALDVVNDGINNKLQLAKTGKYWGQYWLIKPISQPDLSLGTTEPGSSFIIPADWFKAGNEPQSYDAGIDKGAGQDGKNAATIKSISENINGFGNLMQNCLPDKYLGKRVRMTGYMKTQDVASWAGFWMRVDQANSKISLAFDNMYDGIQNRSITGSTPWTKYEIVLDVPMQASNLAYGALLVGTGQIWIDNLNFEEVDNSVPTTGKEHDKWVPLKEPSNLDFEK